MAEENKKSAGSSAKRPKKPATPKAVKIRIVQHYFDVELQRKISVGEEMEVSKARADVLIGKGFAVQA